MASSRIRGITIEIDGDTTKLGKALDGAEKSSKNLSSELKGVNSLLKLDPSNVELLTQKQTILNDSISATKDKLNTLKSAQAEVQAQFDRGDITAEQFRDFQREIVATEQKLNRLEDEAKEFWSVIQQQLKIAGDKVSEFGGKVEEAGKKFTLVSGAATAGLAYGTKYAASFEGAVLKIPTPLLASEYPNAVNNPEIVTSQNIMKDTMMDALTSFNNQKYQNGTGGNIGELTRLLKQYMPEIINNIGRDIVMDGRTIGKTLAPVINTELGAISSRQQRGY